jgi:hypothetical protein
VVFGFVNGDTHALQIAPADDGAELKLVVEPLARAERRLRLVRTFGLAGGPAERNSARYQSGRAAVIADGHPFVIWQQRVVRPEQLADIRGVVNADVEVGVIANLARQPEFDGVLVQQRELQSSSLGTSSTQSTRESETQSSALCDGHRQHTVHSPIDEPCCSKVQDLVTDGHTGPPRIAS